MELKPCPFCGGEVQYKDPYADRGGQVAGLPPYYFICVACDYIMNFGDKSQLKNVQKWNQRKTLQTEGKDEKKL